MDVRYLTVGPVQENTWFASENGRGLLIDPGDEPELLKQAIADLDVTIDAILITHCHFDHVGAVAELARHTKAPVYCPAGEVMMLENINDYVRFAGFGPFESYTPEETVKGGDKLELAGQTIDVYSTPGHSPDHVTYVIGNLAFSGDVLFQGSIGRTDLPGSDHQILMRSIAMLLDTLPEDTNVLPGHMGPTTLAQERATNPFLRELAPAVSAKLQAPRGTYDVLPELAAERAQLEETAAKILTRAGYGRIETPTFEATHLFSRTVGEATDVVQKEMYTFPDSSGDSLTLRPEGTAPTVRAYLEHGMHKEPQPVKLWYLSSFFRYERPQAGRFRQFWQVGAEAIGSADPAVDAELILLLGELLEALGARDVKLVLATLGQPDARAAYREELKAYLRAHEDQLSEEVRSRIDLNPLRAFDAKHAPTQRVMADAPRLIDRLPQDDLDHFGEVRYLLDQADMPHKVDTTLVRGLDYYTRTLFEFQSGALEAAQNTLGGGGRYDNLAEQIGGPRTPGMGWAAGVERMLMASTQAAPAQPLVDLYVAYEPDHKAPAFRLAADARRAGASTRLELAGRSLKGQLKQASRSGARYVAIFGDDGVQLRDREGGEDKLVEPDTVMHHIRGRI